MRLTANQVGHNNGHVGSNPTLSVAHVLLTLYERLSLVEKARRENVVMRLHSSGRFWVGWAMVSPRDCKSRVLRLYRFDSYLAHYEYRTYAFSQETYTR